MIVKCSTGNVDHALRTSFSICSSTLLLPTTGWYAYMSGIKIFSILLKLGYGNGKQRILWQMSHFEHILKLKASKRKAPKQIASKIL